MNKTTSFAARTSTRLILSTALALGLTGAALATDISPASAGQVMKGASKTSVNAALGEPTEHMTYLFAKGSTDLYYITGGTLGNEAVLAVRYDPQGNVISSRRINAGFYDLNRME